MGIEAGIRKAQKKCNEYDQVSEKGVSNLRFKTITRNLLGSMKANSSVSLRLAEFGIAKKVRK